MKIARFEDIEARQEARKLVRMVYDVIKKNAQFRRDFRLVGQVKDASVSTMSNIAEGFARRSNREFIQFLFISKSSAAEVQSQFYVALDQGYITKDDFGRIYDQAEIVSKLDSGFIKYLNSTYENRPKPSQLNKLNKPNEPNKLNKPK